MRQEPGSVDRAATAYDGDNDDELPTTDDEVPGKESDSGARDSGGGGGGMGCY